MVKVFKWGLLGPAGLIVAAAVLAGVVYHEVSSKDTNALKTWIGGQVRDILQTYLTPQIEFQDLEYIYPRTVHVNNLRLTSPDPDNAGKTIDILKVARTTMELAEIPQEGQPIRIQKLILDHPSLQLVVPAGTGGGLLVGFSNFVKQDVTTKPQEALPKEVRLSEVLQISLVQLIGGEVVYQTRRGEVKTLRMDGIDSKMDIQKDKTGWYKLAAKLEHQGIFKLDAAGRLNLDDPKLELTAVALDMKLGRGQDRYLPPQIQSLMRDHQITGALSMKLSGTVPFADAIHSKLSAKGSIRDAHFVAGAYRGQADSIDIAIEIADARLNITRFLAHTLRGQADLTGTIDLGGDYQGNLALNLSDIRIEDTLRAIETGGEPSYKGLLSAEVKLNCPLTKVLTEARGGGLAQLREGKASSLPVFAQVLGSLASLLKKVTFNTTQSRDAGEFSFEFAGRPRAFHEDRPASSHLRYPR